MNEVIVVDYGMGNLRSVQKKLIRVGAKVKISDDPEIIAGAGKLVLPGVGHFANGVKKLKDLGLWDVLNKKVLIDKIPILGICLGMQLIAKHSEEGNVDGLGWLDAEVIRFRIKDKLKYKIPHIGWNNIVQQKKSILLKNIPEDAMFYFVHAYHMICHDPSDVLVETNYEYDFVSAVQKENIFGTQFHPEKSHDWGEQIFKNFIAL